MAAQQDAGARVRGQVVSRPIIYGNHSTYFKEKRQSDGHTHEWTLFVKPFYNEDMSKWVRKVTFKLHESIPNPTRTIEKAPFSITETGWGEFEAIIKIYFHDTTEKPATAYHFLRLFQNDPLVQQGKKPLINETYDEIVFLDPTPLMLTSLQQSIGKRPAVARHDTDFMSEHTRQEQLIADAHKQVRAEINDLKESLKEAQSLIGKYSQMPNSNVDAAADDQNELKTV